VSFADVERALVALEKRGARAFDRDGCDLVGALIARGAELPRPADALLLERVRVHLTLLCERFERARERTAARLEDAERAHGPLPEQRAAFERGELRALRRELRRLDRGRSAYAGARRAERQRCAGAYDAALAELSAQFTVARAVDEVPAHAGPYNPLRIATDLLARIGAVSPTYLAVQLKRLDELAVMLTLPEPPSAARPTPAPPPKKPRAKGKRRARSV
jgi:hypothetical protein